MKPLQRALCGLCVLLFLTSSTSEEHVVELSDAGPSESFELAHSGSSGDGKRFRLVTDRAATTGNPVAGSFEGKQSKEQCFQLCILEARCRGVFLTTDGECSLVNEISTMEGSTLKGLSFLKRSSLPAKYAPDVKGPLGSQTLQAQNEAEGKRDRRIIRANALVAHKESRDAQIAWRESDVRLNEQEQSSDAREQLRVAIAKGHSDEYAALSKSDLQMRQERAAALEALVEGRRTAKQTEADTTASTITRATEQRKDAVNKWVEGRATLRQMRNAGSTNAQKMLHDDVQKARQQRVQALSDAAQHKLDSKSRALADKQAELLHVHSEEQMAVSHSYEAKAQVLQEASLDVSMPADGSATTDEAVAAAQDAAHTDVEQQAAHVQQVAVQEAQKEAKDSTLQTQSTFVAAMSAAVAESETATGQANSGLTASIDTARVNAATAQQNALENYEIGITKADVTKKDRLEQIETREGEQLVRVKADYKSEVEQLQQQFDAEVERLGKAHDDRVEAAKETKKNAVKPLFDNFNSQKAQAAREKASSYRQVAQHEAAALDEIPELPETEPLPVSQEEIAAELAQKSEAAEEPAAEEVPAAVEEPAAAEEEPAAVEEPAAAEEEPTAAEEVPAAAEEVPAAAEEEPAAAEEVPAAAEVPAEVPAAAVEEPTAAEEVPTAAVEPTADEVEQAEEVEIAAVEEEADKAPAEPMIK